MHSTFTRSFETVDQIDFATISGDWNPIHVDPIAARRTSYGQIAHGIHTLAWALDRYLGEHGATVPSRIRVAFLKPVNLSEEIRLSRREEGCDVVLLVQRKAKAIASIRITPGPLERPRYTAACTPAPRNVSGHPDVKSFEELNGMRGVLEAWGDAKALEDLFPNLVAIIGSLRTAALLGLSRLVGMHCPGLNSIFSGLDFAFLPTDEARLEFQVTRHSIPNAPIRVSFTGGGLEGNLDAFFRPSPAIQVGMEAIRGLVKPDEFAGQIALIIGGSRGLGEVMAKIIAAGGGHSVITYLLGEKDARNVVEDIASGGGRCRTLQLDALRAQSGLEGHIASGDAPTHVYYFASPAIQNNKGPSMDRTLLDSFMSYYVDAFDEICRVLARGKGARVFYPSTVFLDQKAPGFAEYICAKSAGEALCRYLANEYGNLSFHVDRLPRMHTDQTNSFLEKKGAAPHEIMLGVARKMNLQEATQWARTSTE
ncbi:MAG: hypothetical protein M3Y08_19450 [Fibrobacterota bacterium]|nr:hypothetical protein [Fibrobacterota bacterium]